MDYTQGPTPDEHAENLKKALINADLFDPRNPYQSITFLLLDTMHLIDREKTDTFRVMAGLAEQLYHSQCPAQRDCPVCKTPLDRRHHPGTFALPECWVWGCLECEYRAAPE